MLMLLECCQKRPNTVRWVCRPTLSDLRLCTRRACTGHAPGMHRADCLPGSWTFRAPLYMNTLMFLAETARFLALFYKAQTHSTQFMGCNFNLLLAFCPIQKPLETGRERAAQWVEWWVECWVEPWVEWVGVGWGADSRVTTRLDKSFTSCLIHC